MVKINLKLIRPLGRPKRRVLVCFTLFRILGRDGSYRDFSKYLRDFRNNLECLPKYCDARVYIDDTVKLAEIPKGVEVFSYYCREFHHDGTFGSVIRLIPLMDWPKYDVVWISDVDLSRERWIEGAHHLKLMELGFCDYGYFSIYNHSRPWNSGAEIPVINLRIIAKKPICNLSKLELFLDDILANKHSKILTETLADNELRGKSHNYRNFPYGFDELFTNLYLLPLIPQDKLLVCQFMSVKGLVKYGSQIRSEVVKLEAGFWSGGNFDFSAYRKLVSESNESFVDEYLELADQCEPNSLLRMMVPAFPKLGGWFRLLLDWGIVDQHEMLVWMNHFEQSKV